MRVGKELILATKPFAKEIRWKSWYYTLTTLVILIGSLASTFLLPGIFLKLVSSLFSGLVLVRFFVIYHDHQHHAILHQSKIANTLFNIFGVFILAPSSIWKRSHDHHHSHNSKLFSASIGSYPIMTKEKFLTSSDSERATYLITRHPLTIFFGYFSMFIFGMCIQSFRTSPKKHWDSMLALVLHAALTVFLIVNFGWITWLLSLFIPFLVADMIGSYLFYAQHNFPEATFKNNVEWSYAHAALESSSYMPMNPFWKWVTANIGYHHIHHMNSRIPFYRLEETMAQIPELQNVRTTTLNPSDIIACFRLKVWDSEQNKMIGHSELEEEEDLSLESL